MTLELKVAVAGANGAIAETIINAIRTKVHEVRAYDLPGKTDDLKVKFPQENIHAFDTAKEAITNSNIVFIAAENAQIPQVVRDLKPYISNDAILVDLSAVKSVVKGSYDKLPNSTAIYFGHQLYKPTPDTKGKKFVSIPHRIDENRVQLILHLLSSMKHKVIHCKDYETHDSIMGNVQVATHLEAKSRDLAWRYAEKKPWGDASYRHPLDIDNQLVSLRIIAGNAHVFSDIATLNPYGKKYAQAYVESISHFLELIDKNDEKSFRKEITRLKKLILSKEVDISCLDDIQQFSLTKYSNVQYNTYLSVLSTWKTLDTLNMDPHEHREMGTPPYMARLVAAYTLAQDEKLLESAVRTAFYKNHFSENSVPYNVGQDIGSDDKCFERAANYWNKYIQEGDTVNDKRTFNKTHKFYFEKQPQKLKEVLEKSEGFFATLPKA